MTSKNTFPDTQSQTIERSNSSSSLYPNSKYEATFRNGFEEYKRDLSNSHNKMFKRKENQLQVIGKGNPIARYNIGAHANFACPTRILPKLSTNSEKFSGRIPIVKSIRPTF